MKKTVSYFITELENVKLWIAAAVGIGCLCYFSLPFEPSLFYGLLFFLGGLLFSFIIRLFFPAYWKIYYFVTTLYLIAGGFCLAWWQSHKQEDFYRISTHAIVIHGKIIQIENLALGKRRVEVGHVHFLTFPDSEQKEWQRHIRFTLKRLDNHDLQIGDWIEVKVMLSHPFPPAQVKDYDLQFQAWFKGIGAYGYALAPVKIVKKGRVYSLRNLREHIAMHIGQILSGTTGAIAQIFLTGMETSLSSEARHDFAVSGLSHLLAIAGLHLATVMLIVGGGVRWFLLRSEYLALYWPVKTIAVIIGWLAGFVYLLLTGFHLPAIRSLVMATLILVALLYNRQAVSMHNLMIAALLILLWSPESVMNVSFQMSMAAVMALIAGYKIGYVTFFQRDKENSFFRNIILHFGETAWVSMLAGLAVCPIIMLHFHELNLYFIFANLIAVPLTIFWILPCGILSLMAMPLGLDMIFLHLMGWGIHFIIIIAHFIAYLPRASFKVGLFSRWGVGLYFIGLCIVCLCITPLRWTGFMFIIGSIAVCIFSSVPDIVTSANGQMIGVRQKNELWLACQSGCNDFTVDAWRKSLKISKVSVLSSTFLRKDIYCTQYYCKFLKKNVLIIFKSIPETENKIILCHDIRVELSFLWNNPYCNGQSYEINKKSNWINGSHSIWLNSLKIETDRAYRGTRPWVMELIQRGVPNLPMAGQE